MYYYEFPSIEDDLLEIGQLVLKDVGSGAFQHHCAC
jgi:hypothetical protein